MSPECSQLIDEILDFELPERLRTALTGTQKGYSRSKLILQDHQKGLDGNQKTALDQATYWVIHSAIQELEGKPLTCLDIAKHAIVRAQNERRDQARSIKSSTSWVKVHP